MVSFGAEMDPSPFDTPSAPLGEQPPESRRNWRWIVFASTWLAYAAFYLTRKNFAVAEPAFMAEFGWSKTDVGSVLTVYLTVYAIGQFTLGVVCDRVGSRVLLAAGFLATAALSALLGFASSITLMAVLYGANGLAQAAGWPSVTRAMRNWTSIEERGSVMGWWGTNYPLGDAASTAIATFILGLAGWRAAFWAPAALILIVGTGVIALVRDHPRDVGLPPMDQARVDAPAPKRAFDLEKTALALANLRVMTLGLAYFFVKFIRYGLTYWTGVYLVERMGFSVTEAGYMQVPLPLVGLAGSIAAGMASDKLFGARRAPVAFTMLLILAGALCVMLYLPSNGLLVGIDLALIGFMTFGPDMLFSTAAAMDFAKEESAATVLGAINGMGSIGAAVSGWAVGALAQNFGWEWVFYALIAMALMCALVTRTLWNARPAQ